MNPADIEDQVKDISSHEIENVNGIDEVLFSPEEETVLVRKIDLSRFYRPSRSCTCSPILTEPNKSMSNQKPVLHRANAMCSISNAKISGMEVDLNLTCNQILDCLGGLLREIRGVRGAQQVW